METTDYKNGATELTERTDPHSSLRIRHGAGRNGRLERGRDLAGHASTCERTVLVCPASSRPLSRAKRARVELEIRSKSIRFLR
jgi:hypothetical protein